MARANILIVVAIVAATNSSASGQSLLKQLEKGLQKGAAAVKAAVEATPGSGYLGAVLDEDPMSRGVKVASVRPGAPADLGGLKSGDLITAIDTKPVTKLDDLDAVLNNAIPGQRLRLTVDRGGKQQPLNVLLGTRPAPATSAPPATAEPAPATTVPPPAPTLTNPADPSPVSPPLLTPPTTAEAPANPSLPAAPLAATPAPGAGAPATIRSQPLDLAVPRLNPAPAESAPAAPTIGAQPPAAPAPADAPAVAPPEPRPAAIDSLPAPAPAASAASPSVGGGGASLGIMVDKLTEESRVANGLRVGRGALITSVRPDSPAARAGLPVGGLIVSFDGRLINSDDDLVAAIRGARAGQEVELGYYQGERFGRKTIRLGAAQSSAAPGGGASGGVSPLSPLRSGPLALGRGAASGDRPLLNRVEQLVDGFAARGGPSTSYNPSEMAELLKSVNQLSDQVRALDERLKALENKTSAPGPTPVVPPPAPSFGPAGNP
jgi:membrane-associated protease RseP (regulator of RpoE activity)